jgi:predicted amidophosphoribosyltransferase
MGHAGAVLAARGAGPVVCPECRKELNQITHATRQKRLRRGFCGECGAKMAKRGHKSCQGCLDRKSLKMRALRASRKVNVRVNPTIVVSEMYVWMPPEDRNE